MPAVLGVVGSPRTQGNTHILVSRILESAASAGTDTRLLMLGDMGIRECNGCHACWKGLRCSKNDDMNAVYPLIAKSDAIVFGTPVYWYGPTALMKAFLDRFVYFNCPEHRPKIRATRALVAVPFEEKDPKTAELLVNMFHRSFNWLEIEPAGTILAPGVGEKGDILRERAILDSAFEAGRRLARGTNPD